MFIFFIFSFLLGCDGQVQINLLEPKANYGVATYNYIALFAGGYDTNGVTDSVAVFDALTFGTSNTNDLQEPRAFSAGTTVQNFGVFAGGILEDGNCSNAVDIFDFTTVTRVSGASLSVARAYMAATSIRDLAIFAGGWNGTFLDTVDIYNSTSQQWTTARLSVPRSLLAATSVGDYALFAGGKTATGVSNTVDIYDVVSGKWTTTTLTAARQQIAAVTIDTSAYFFGGYNSSAVDVYHFNNDTWSIITNMPFSGVHTATAVGTGVFFFDNELPSTTIQIFGTQSLTWQTMYEAIKPRFERLAAAVDIENGQVAIFAGGYLYQNRTAPSSDVDYFTDCEYMAYPWNYNKTCPGQEGNKGNIKCPNFIISIIRFDINLFL
jgi:hypothetical protein